MTGMTLIFRFVAPMLPSLKRAPNDPIFISGVTWMLNAPPPYIGQGALYLKDPTLKMTYISTSLPFLNAPWALNLKRTNQDGWSRNFARFCLFVFCLFVCLFVCWGVCLFVFTLLPGGNYNFTSNPSITQAWRHSYKGWPIASDFSPFFRLSEILVSQENSYFSYTPGEFYSWKMNRSE